MNLFAWLRGGYKVGDLITCNQCDGKGFATEFFERDERPRKLKPMLCAACNGKGKRPILAPEATA